MVFPPPSTHSAPFPALPARRTVLSLFLLFLSFYSGSFGIDQSELYLSVLGLVLSKGNCSLIEWRLLTKTSPPFLSLRASSSFSLIKTHVYTDFSQRIYELSLEEPEDTKTRQSKRKRLDMSLCRSHCSLPHPHRLTYPLRSPQQETTARPTLAIPPSAASMFPSDYGAHVSMCSGCLGLEYTAQFPLHCIS